MSDGLFFVLAFLAFLPVAVVVYRRPARRSLPSSPTARDRLLLALREDYVHDRITLDELEARTARILSGAVDATNNFQVFPPPCSPLVLVSGSGVFGTFCECGHSTHRHYDGGCNDCDRLLRHPGKPGEVTPDGRDWRVPSQFPRPQMEEIGRSGRPVEPR